MKELIKRLSVIKVCIALEDDEAIAHQLEMLSTEGSETIHSIVAMIKAYSYAEALNEIELFINKNTGLIAYKDEQVNALKLELKMLEKMLQSLSEKKNEYINQINEFNKEYIFHVGDLLQSILNTKAQIAGVQQAVKETSFKEKKQSYELLKFDVEQLKQEIYVIEKRLKALDEFSDKYDELYNEYLLLKAKLSELELLLRDARVQAKAAYTDTLDSHEYEEAKADYENFEQENQEIQEEIKASHDLTKEQIKQLKKAYRKAAKLCHPDVVSNELKEQAHKLMQELNEAYSLKDLEKVLSILTGLESGEEFEVASDALFDAESLEVQISSIKQQLKAIEKEILAIEGDETLQVINDIEDRNEYFQSLADQLKQELELYEQQLKQAESIQA